MALFVLILSFCFSGLSLAQTYGTGDSHILKFGNGEEGYYSGSFLNQGQGSAGNDPKVVKTEFGFGMYSGKTAFDKGTEAKASDETVMNAQYKNQIYALFSKDYFPSAGWNGAPLVEKVYSIIEGIKGDQVKAKNDAKKHRMLNPTNMADLAEWGELKDEDVKNAYYEKYKVLMGEEPSLLQVNDFYMLFGAMKNSIPWSGLCNQFSAANANPYFNKVFTDLYDNEGQVYLCQKPITLGEVKEATTLLYDAVSFNLDQKLGGSVNFTPSGSKDDNSFVMSEMDFLKKLPANTYIDGKTLDGFRKKYSNYVYKNYFDRMGKSPSGLDFCALDNKFASTERQEYGSEKDNFMKNKVPIMNLNGAGEVWNSAVTGAQRDVQMYNVYDGTTINSSGIKASNSFSDLLQLYIDKKKKGGMDVASADFKRVHKMLLRNYNVMCRYAKDHEMTFSKSYCTQIDINTIDAVPAPAGDNMSEWSTYPQTILERNNKVDDALYGLALTFAVLDNGNPIMDGKGLPRLRSTEGAYFDNVKIQNVNLGVDYVAQADFADMKKGAKKAKESFEGLVVVDQNQNPAKQVGCSWKNVWSYDENLKSYKSRMPASFMTLDIPACPTDTKAKNLLDQVQKCATFKDFLQQYNNWMLESSQGYNPQKISDDIDAYRLKFPETNVDWAKLKKEILTDMGKVFVDESKG